MPNSLQSGALSETSYHRPATSAGYVYLYGGGAQLRLVSSTFQI